MKKQFHQDASEATGVGIQVSQSPSVIHSITVGRHGDVNLFDFAGPGDPPSTAPYRLIEFQTPDNQTVTHTFYAGLPVSGIFISHSSGGVLIVYSEGKDN